MFPKILVPLDGSELSERVLFPLRRLMRVDGGVVTLLRIMESKTGELDRAPAAAQGYLVELCQRLNKEHDVDARPVVEHGDPAERILSCAASIKPDLVAMATHGRSGLSRLVRGSVAEKVLRECEAPLLLCNPNGLGPTSAEAPFRRILVPLDGSDLADAVLPLVMRIASVFHPEVILLRIDDLAALDGPGDRLRRTWEVERSLGGHEEALKEAGTRKVTILTASARNPAERILETATRLKVDLLAMSTHGRSGLERLRFGSVAEQVLRSCPCPTLVQRRVTEDQETRAP